MPAKRLAVLDTYYPPAIKAMEIDPSLDYKQNLEIILGYCFGTGDYYSYNLRKDFDTIDMIVNHTDLQKKWSAEVGQNHYDLKTIAFDQILYYKPDILFCQDLSFFDPAMLRRIKDRGILLAGQCSCPFPPPENVREFKVLFTSFPHYLERFEALGVQGVYNPLAFETRLLDRLTFGARDIPILFVGGVGWPSHWKYGMNVLEAIAFNFPQAQFYGYGYESLPSISLVKKAWGGEAWGLRMYQLLARAKIVINRHGEVSEGYTNNMRTFEATGCGALLFTEESKNLKDFFQAGSEVLAYKSIDDLVNQVKTILEDPIELELIATAGQERTLKDHTYHKRMKLISRTLLEILQ